MKHVQEGAIMNSLMCGVNTDKQGVAGGGSSTSSSSSLAQVHHIPLEEAWCEMLNQCKSYTRFFSFTDLSLYERFGVTTS